MEAEVKVEFDRLHDELHRQNKRIEELEKIREERLDLAVMMKELKLLIATMQQDIINLKKDVEQMKTAPLRQLASAKEQAVKTTVSIIVTAVVTSLVWAVINKGGI